MTCHNCRHNADRPAWPAPRCLASGTGYYVWCRMVDGVEDEHCERYEPDGAEGATDER